MTVAMHRSGQASRQHLPRPACFFTFSRNERTILLGYAANPSVQTSKACMHWQHARTCWKRRSMSVRSRGFLTTPANHKRVVTSIAKAIQIMSFLPFARMRICLDVLALDLSLFHNSGMHSLAMLSCALLPCGYCPFIESKRMNNRLKGASIGKEGHHHCYLLFICT